MTETERTPGIATNGEVADVLEELAPILDRYPIDLRVIATAAALFIILDPEIDTDYLKTGVDQLVTFASRYVAKGMSDLAWTELPTDQMN